MKIFTNHRYALITGIVLGVLLIFAIGATKDTETVFNHLALARWVHIVAGVFWIGLLYYLNAVQVPAMAAATEEASKGGPGPAAIGKYVAPRALFWFRWAALVTWVAGAWLLDKNFVHAFALGSTIEGGSLYHLTIGIGAWLGTIMLLNVWGVIWPNQKKVLGIKPATDEEKAQARKVALYASRTNFILSFPMLLCMGGATHGLPF
jgi:uncharacterized membrane protein